MGVRTNVVLVLAGAVGLMGWSGCGDDGGNGGPVDGGDGGPGYDTTGCDAVLEPSADDAETIQTAFIEAQSGDTICLAPGTYAPQRELSVSATPDITVRGLGETREDVVVDFADQTVGDDAFTVDADGFTIENLWIRNSPGNGVVVRADDSVFRGLKVSWDAGSTTDNGAYAVYPNHCMRTLVEDNEVVGASDAGIYVGQCQHAIVRNNVVHGNVAGIESENSLHVDIYDNTVYDNTGGILVLQEPNLEQKSSEEVLVRGNEVYDNDRANFAREGTTVSVVPAGTGLLVLAGKDTEIKENDVHDNDSVGVLIVSYDIIELLGAVGGAPDPLTDPYVERVYIHDNTFTNNGNSPKPPLTLIDLNMVETVAWDGITRDDMTDPQICLGTAPPAFIDFDAAGNFMNESTDTTGHECTLPPLPEITAF